MEKLTISPDGLAKTLGIGRNAAYELCNRADFPSIRIGKRFIIPVDGLREWLQTQSQKQDAE